MSYAVVPASPEKDEASPLEAWEVFDLLLALAEKSLVHYEEGAGGEGRFYLLETVREYLQERLAESAEGAHYFRRYRDHFNELIAQPDPEGPMAACWLGQLEREHGNLRRVLEIALSDPDDDTAALRLVGKLHWFWDTRGHLVEGLRWCEKALAQNTDPTRERAEALQGAGNLSHSRGEYKSATKYHAEALAIRRDLGDLEGVGRSLGSMAKAALNQGGIEGAEQLFAESLAASRAAGDRSSEVATLINYGILLGGQEDHAGARSLFEAARKLCLMTDNRRMLLYAVSCLATEAHYAGDYDDARRRHREALGYCREMGDKINIAYTLEGHAAIDLATGDYAVAARLYGAAATVREEIQSPPRPPNRASIEHDLAVLREALGEDFAASYEAGRQVALERMLEELTG